MIKAAGNHDFGVNANHGTSITANKYEPLFKHYYPQNTYRGDIPSVHTRKSYFYHLIGNTTLIISLDSGYDTDLGGEQAKWLDSLLANHSHVPIKIVHYHEPIYPACEFIYVETLNLAKKYWVPLFDKYNVTVAFENHAHSLKRTYPLRDNKRAETGTLYIGDGAWGAIDFP